MIFSVVADHSLCCKKLAYVIITGAFGYSELAGASRS